MVDAPLDNQNTDSRQDVGLGKQSSCESQRRLVCGPGTGHESHCKVASGIPRLELWGGSKDDGPLAVPLMLGTPADPLFQVFTIVHDLLVALALMLIIEGIWPFLSPASFRRVLALIALEGERSLRISGLVTMLLGLGLLYWVN